MQSVAKRWIEGANSSLTSTTLFSTTEGGDFELSAYLSSGGGSAGNGTVTLSITWGDKYGNQTDTSIVLAVGHAGITSSAKTLPIHMFQGASITYLTTVVTMPTGAQYALYLTLKDLSAPGL
jgi:hypothetical protein